LLKQTYSVEDRSTTLHICCGSGSPTDPISFDPIRTQIPDKFILFGIENSCQVINGSSVQTGTVQ